MPNTGFKLIKFSAKKLNAITIDFDMKVSLNRTYESLFIHVVTYRQFSSNEYRRFLFDLWENICGTAEVGDRNMFSKVLKRVISGDSNIFRECPYTPGIYFITMKRMPINRLNFGQILPSGRYRFELTVTDSFNVTNLVLYKLYVSISDRRIEQF